MSRVPGVEGRTGELMSKGLRAALQKELPGNLEVLNTPQGRREAELKFQVILTREFCCHRCGKTSGMFTLISVE